MGIYDREYVRREGPSFLGSIVDRGRICKWLIGINVVAFILQGLTLNQGGFTDLFWLDVAQVQHGQVWRLLTYAFLHSFGIFPFLFAMLFLWWFGSDLEDLYGPREFLAFYLTAVFVGGLAYFLSALAWFPRAAAHMGSSGAIMAVMVLCAIHDPRRLIYLFFLLPVPIWALVAAYLAYDVFVLAGDKGMGGVVAAVDVAAALFAAVYHQLHWRLTEWLPQWGQWRLWRRRLFRPRLRLYREERPREPVGVPSTPALDDEHLEAKMDAILEKISRVGKENLTESERQVLLRASEILRRRRR